MKYVSEQYREVMADLTTRTNVACIVLERDTAWERVSSPASSITGV